MPEARGAKNNLADADPTPDPWLGADDYMAPLRKFQNCRIRDPQTILNFGSRTPIFAPPPGFTQRLGTRSTDFFVSGTFSAGGYTIGFIRIADYAPSNSTTALNQFFGEIAYFQSNTDGLIVDEMRNPGGSVLYVNQIAQFLIPYRFRSIAFEIRATSTWVESISLALASAKAQAAPQYIIDQLQGILHDISLANSEYRGRTGPLPLSYTSINLDPFTDTSGRSLAYTKPLMVLVDEFSASGGDAFAATIQDNERGASSGWEPWVAGKSVVLYNVGMTIQSKIPR